VSIEAEDLPVNTALLQLISLSTDEEDKEEPQSSLLSNLSSEDLLLYKSCRKCVEDLALFLKNCGGVPLLSRPMQRKLVTLVTCQLSESEGRARAVRAARSLGERTVTELILQHQNPQQLSANLWAAVRARGCQFLGPAMQEEVLRLVLLALEDGSALSRKVLVMFVVQRLEPHFPQASKTSIGHVVQLLYRASCFKVSKREGDSSLMQLKEEFRTYEALRREHDAQIVQIATEAGLRIAPDQWSSLLYGDSAHKSHMQSIIDKLQTPQSFGQSVQELVIALQRTGDPHNLSNLRPSLELLAALDPSPEASIPSWSECESALIAARLVVRGLVDFVASHGGNRSAGGRQTEPAHGSHGVKYKTSLCRDLLRGGCPRGANCTFAHSEEELDKYRSRHRKNSGHTNGKLKSCDSLGSQENLAMSDVAGGVAMITDSADPSGFYLNGCSLSGALASNSTQPAADGAIHSSLNRHGVVAPRPHGFGPSSYSYRHVGVAQYADRPTYPPPPPLPTNVYGPSPHSHMYGPSLPQPEYGMPAPIADYRPIETARLIPSLASQSLVVLQNRKQEILDQLEKIGSVAPLCPSTMPQHQQQMYSIWNSQTSRGGATAQTRTTPSSAYTSQVVVGAGGRGPEDDDFIPFDPPICSKYGPISRLSRVIPRPSNPVQASAAFGHSLISTQTMTRTPLTSTGSMGSENGCSTGAGTGRSGVAPPGVAQGCDLYAESERMKLELEMLKQQIDELKMATRESVLTEGRQRLARELHLIEENIRDKERELRLTQRKRRNVSNLPVNGKATATVDWDMKFFTSSEDDEDNGIANGMRELELRLQHELEEQE